MVRASRKEYAGIDLFRLIAALLVVAIHTSPLASWNETADFLLTRVVARVAVPFFFMATGFFLLPDGHIHRFLKRSTIIYGIATLLYLPISLYAGILNQTPLLPQLVKDILFDGTFYHLWYLPASICGMLVVSLLVRKLQPLSSLIIVFLLYGVGLFGDSYYGLAQEIPLVRQLYDGLFWFSDYTRNGLFFAPLFLLMGGMIGRQNRTIERGIAIAGLVVSLLLMMGEALLLHRYALQRHDSMYLMLPICMYFLFQWLLHWKGRDLKGLRDISLLVYLLHPLMIIGVRGFAKLTSTTALFIENSPLHFAAVVLCSVVAAVLVEKGMHHAGFQKKKASVHHRATPRSGVGGDQPGQPSP